MTLSFQKAHSDIGFLGSMLGSLTLYRRLLLENVFFKPELRAWMPFSRSQADLATLPSFGHGIAGIMAGTTVSFIAAPVEHIKARLQVQYAADKSKRMYSGPIDCLRKIVRILVPSLRIPSNRPSASHPRYQRRLPRPLGNSLLPLLLLLLVGFLRHPHPLHERQHQDVRTGHQLLGWWYLRPDLLANLVPVRRGQATAHGGPDGRRAQ